MLWFAWLAAAFAQTAPHEEFDLDNGLHVVLAPDPALSGVAVNLTFDVGSGQDPADRSGLAHLFEHLAFQGTVSAPGNLFVTAATRGMTGDGATGPDHTDYFLLAPPEQTPAALFLASEVLGWLMPAVTEATLRDELGVVQSERLQRYDSAPMGPWFQALARLIYPEGHPYRDANIGSEASLQAITLADVQGFFATWYVPGHATLAVVGPFDPGPVRRDIRRWFGPIPAGPALPTPIPPVVLAETARGELRRPVPEPMLLVSWPVDPGATDDVQLALDANFGAVGTPLYDRLVASGLAASAETWLLTTRGTSLLTLFVDAAPGQGVDALRDATLAAVADVCSGDRPVDAARLAAAAAQRETTNGIAWLDAAERARELQRRRLLGRALDDDPVQHARTATVAQVQRAFCDATTRPHAELALLPAEAE